MIPARLVIALAVSWEFSCHRPSETALRDAACKQQQDTQEEILTSCQPLVPSTKCHNLWTRERLLDAWCLRLEGRHANDH